MDASFMLQLTDAGGKASSASFNKNKVVIGRDPSSDLVIDHVEISRKHLVISAEKNGIFAEDQHSTNGTFLGGKRLTKKVALESGDTLTLGQDHMLRVILEQAVTDMPETHEADEVLEPMEEPATIAAFSEPEMPAVEQEALKMAEKPAPVKKIPLRKKEPRVRQPKSQRPTWVVILLAALAFIVVFCVIPLVVIEVTNQWCDLFAGFFNSMSPGVCP